MVLEKKMLKYRLKSVVDQKMNQVKSVKVKAGKQTHDSCGIDGELFALNGEVISTMLPEQCRLIGNAPERHS